MSIYKWHANISRTKETQFDLTFYVFSDFVNLLYTYDFVFVLAKIIVLFLRKNIFC